MKKKLMTALALILVVAMSVAGTYAYLTSTQTVTNTFTVGKVAIKLDEAKTNTDGVKVDKSGEPLAEGAADYRIPNDTDKTSGNAYKLMPGHTYVKDPTVHVVANSENSWVFVKVVNGISTFESTDADYTSIANQITANDWAQLKDSKGNDVTGVYYKNYTKGTTVTNYPVFSQFKIADNADKVSGWDSVNTDNNVVITAYAIQKDGFNDAYTAWGEVSKQDSATQTPGTQTGGEASGETSTEAGE